ncbi:MAG TPA: tRNA pseudouridine(55) synthase TruB [Bacteroidales bacterium]|nr:tRNA pseudouridine(55) synthase TruB [Bacteroidales bacterium]
MDNKEISNIFTEGQVLSFNKPLYWTSFDLVNKIRIMLRTTFRLKKIKVGHAGTLDPLASGVVLICTGKSTKRIDEFRDLEKEYVATIYLGQTTPSFDLETETEGDFPVGHITEKLVLEILDSFKGRQMQMPPSYSAKLIGGKRSYEFARKGVEKELSPSEIYFHRIELISFNLPEVTVKLLCSKGTYIRSFARDLGLALGSGAYLSALERTAIGNFSVKKAFTVESFEEYLKIVSQTPDPGT